MEALRIILMSRNCLLKNWFSMSVMFWRINNSNSHKNNSKQNQAYERGMLVLRCQLELVRAFLFFLFFLFSPLFPSILQKEIFISMVHT